MAALSESRLVAAIGLALDLLTALAAAALVAVPLVAALAAVGVFDAGDGRPVETLLRVDIAVDNGADAGTTRGLRVQGDSTLQLPGDRAFLVSLGVTELLGLVGLYALVNFRRLFAALRKGASFAADNAQYLRRAGQAIVAWHLLAPPLRYAAADIALAEAPALPAAVSLHPAVQISVGGLLAGLAIVVLAHLLHDAAMLKQENELTV